MNILERIDLIYIIVKDVDGAKIFYTDVLGCKELSDYSQGEQRWVALKVPAGETTITLTTLSGNMQPGTLELNFITADIENAHTHIEKSVKGVSEIKDWWDGKGKWFDLNDPEGNHIVIHQA